MTTSNESFTIDAAPKGNTSTVVKSRIAAIDVMRGLVIIIMMLDHVRERFFMHTPVGDPIDVNNVGTDLYFTRLLTHLCAPVFIFLTGLSAWLYSHHASGSYRNPTGFLFKRGLFLVLIEVTLIYLVWFDTLPHTIYLQVIWAIGVCMIALSVLCHLNYWVIGALGFLIVFGHNALTPIDFAPDEFGYGLWAILHDQNNIAEVGGITIRASYPVLPWIGVILLGYFAGPLFAKEVDILERRKILIGIGVSCLMLLMILRGFNIYGETLPWMVQETAIGTVKSFLNFTKYPPSLDFMLITLGIGFFLLAWFESMQKHNKVLDLFETYGSVPMFVYIVHLYAILFAYMVLWLMFGATHGDRYGFDAVWWIWVGTIALVLALYPLNKAFAAYKHREKRNKPWLSYF